jgi:branched-chain amino acid transport system ATP-binding protein
MLEIRDLHAGYGGYQVLQGVNLTVGAGELVALLGANGAGKTTLNNIVSAIYQPMSGSIRFDGQETGKFTPQQIVSAGLIQVPEGRRVFPNLSIRENLELGSYQRATKFRKVNLERVFSLFPRLRERSSQFAGTLSGGEQQMLAIGRGLMGQPRLLILDEPSLGLSPKLVTEMFELIQRIRADGVSILLVEQNVVQSLECADRAYILEQGRTEMNGPAAALMQDDRLRRAYLGM